mgnify:CR=1 FL=1
MQQGDQNEIHKTIYRLASGDDGGVIADHAVRAYVPVRGRADAALFDHRRPRERPPPPPEKPKNSSKIEPKFEKHDIYHVLTAYPTSVIGEICLSLFNVGSGKKSIYTGGVAILGALLLIEEHKTFLEAYRKGKRSRNYTAWKFEHLLNENTEELRKYIFKEDNELEVFI